MDRNLKMGPWADKKSEKRDLELTESSKNGTLGSRARNCSQKVTGSPLVVRRIVGEDGAGKGRRTSKGLKMKKKQFASLA